MQTTPATMADLYKPVEPEPFTGIAPTPAAPAGPTKGDVLVALRKANQALGARAVRKDGEVANTAAAAPLREVLQSATPLETMRDLYGNGGHPRDELLDTWHKNLTGQTIPEWQESHPPEPKTNSAGFVPEPQGQLQAQVDAVREGRKPAVVLGVGEAKGLNLDGLHQGVATDPTTRRRAVVVAATPDVVKAAVERTKAVGLKQAMGEALGNANPTLTTQTAPDAAVVQHVDNTTGHVLNEQLARPQDAANIQPVPGTTPRVVSPDQALAERQAGTEAEKPTAKPPRLGRKSTEDLIALAESTKDDATYDAARYEMFKRWATDSDEGMSYAYLHDKANKSAITPAEQAAFTDRYNAELEAKVARKGQALGKKFDASVREPVSPVTDESGTVGEAASRAQEPSDDPYAHITQRENTTAAQQGVGRDVLASLERTVRGERDGGNAHVVAEPGNGEDGGALERANNPTARVAEGRPDTTGGHPRPAATGITERVLGPERAHDSNVLGMRLLENFREKGGAQLVGQHVESGHDLAAVSQVYRDPRFETFRVIYTDPTGRVVGEAGYTSRLPGVAAVPPDLPALIGADKQRFGAQEFYILHNHPSGVSTPSRADVDATRVIAAHIPGFRQHVIIDHNEYSVINANGDQVTYPAPHLDGVDFTASPALAHPLIGQRLESIPHVVDIAKQLQTPNGYATLVALDANRHINLLADIPLAMVKDNTPAGQLKLNELVRRAIAESGAGGDRFIVLPHGENIGPALGPMTRGLAADIVNADGSSARLSGLRRSEDFFLKTAQPTRVLESAQSVPLESAAVQEAEKRTFTKPFSDATRTVTAGVVAQARSEEIHPALLSAMTLRQIDQQYGKKLPALRPWIGSLMERGAAASRISAKADRVALQWEQSVKSSAERKALADVLLRESLAELNLNNTDPKYIASLEPEQRAEYHTLRAKLATLSPEAREIRTKAHEVLREQWSYTREALGKFISQTVADPAMRAERLKGLDDLMGRNRGNYFPLSRFGDRIVVARGAAKDGRDIVSFHESAASVEQEVRRLKAEGVSPRDITVTLRAERDPSQRPTAGFLGELHAMVDHADMDTSTREDLHEALQQLYLKSLPELSGAKHMIRRQNIEGYSQDALRSFADAVTRGSRYAAHLEYAPAIHAAAESAESQSQSAEKRQVAVVVGRKDGQAPVVRVTPVGVDRLEAAKQLARDGYAPEFFNTTVEGARERLAGALEGVPSEQIDKFVDQVQALAQRRPDGVEDLRAAKALYNRMIKLQQYHGTDSLDKVVDALGKVGYTWYLGFSPSFWAMNMLQNPMIGIPHLGARYGVTKTSVEWLNAARWFAGVRIGKRLRDATTPFSIEWLRDQVKAGELKGISKQELDMLQQLEDRQVLDFTQAMDLSRIGKASSGTAYKFLRLAAAGAHHTEVFNRVTFALAAYRLALKSSADITHEEAVRRAEDDVAAAHFDYSFANKPAMMRGKSRLVFMFQQYRQHMLYWWGNTIKDMVKGETPEDRGRALKAALLMGAAQGIFAGAMGLPFVGTIGQLANMFASDNDDGEPFDFKRWITQAAVDATGSQKAGEVMANGIFAAVGADVSRRIGQADLLPLINMGSKSYAQHTDDKVRDYLFDLLGPLGSIAVDAAKSVDMFSSGQTLQGLAAASPQAAKGIIQAYALDTEGLKNKRGQVLATADKFDGSDRAMQLLGVKPMDVTHVQADRGRVLDAEYYFKQRAQILEQSFVQAWTRQDDKGMSDALDGIKEFNNKLMKGNLATKSNMVTGQKLESALKTYMQQQMMLALSNGAAASRQELMMAMRMSGLYNPVALGATPTALPGNMPGLPGLP
ncbi:PLxRFG domain-containing protein [Candidimonas nitroreducens]|uniref:MPN domain-containing protein n=1 Tax=Candidimonas nitroreducens TaxID=683354 RepID=A0A225LXY1_9BURK|nr:PLxRFG domain-containing protein [Candidimonas nitroreducens]OWT53392.1 hypothetical protein CEY11_24880 [Candidimonas nitroreducens]